jgi:hypothetical protein
MGGMARVQPRVTRLQRATANLNRVFLGRPHRNGSAPMA